MRQIRRTLIWGGKRKEIFSRIYQTEQRGIALINSIHMLTEGRFREHDSLAIPS
jgi:hypothetical protein